MKTNCLLVVGMLLCSLPASAADRWQIDKQNSTVGFQVRHFMLSNVSGNFADVSGTVDYDGKHLEQAVIDAQIAAASIDTNMSARDQHLRSRSVFDVVSYPEIAFKSERIHLLNDGTFEIFGRLSMHGVAEDVILKADRLTTTNGADGTERIVVSAVTALKRKDFGITVDKAVDYGGALVGDDVKVHLTITLEKQR